MFVFVSTFFRRADALTVMLLNQSVWAGTAGNVLPLSAFSSDKKWSVPLHSLLEQPVGSLLLLLPLPWLEVGEKDAVGGGLPARIQDQSVWTMPTKAPIPLFFFFNL